MVTLNELASRVANILNRVPDHALRERVKAAFKDVFATRIRQSVEKHGIDDTIILPVNIPVELDTKSKQIANFKLFKTKYKVPTPLRFYNDAPFVYVGINKPIDDNIPCSYKSDLEIELSGKKKLGGFFRFYNMDNGYVKLYVTYIHGSYSLDTSAVKEVVLSSIYEDPEEIINLWTSGDSGDYPIPLPRDMIESILLEILKTEFNYNTQDSEVKA